MEKRTLFSGKIESRKKSKLTGKLDFREII